MPPPRILLLIGVVILAAGVTVVVASLARPVAPVGIAALLIVTLLAALFLRLVRR